MRQLSFDIVFLVGKNKFALGDSVEVHTLSATIIHCSDDQAANLWYDFSNPPRRSIQTISALSSIGYLGSII